MALTTKTPISLKLAGIVASLYAAFQLQEAKVQEIKEAADKHEAMHEARDAKMLEVMNGMGKDLSAIKTDLAYIRPRVKLIKDAVQVSGLTKSKMLGTCQLPKFGPYSMNE